MKSIGDLVAAARNQPSEAEQPAEGRAPSPARYVFMRMHGAYGALWLDKWRTGLLDSDGKDRGVISVMAQWDIALAGFERETIIKACAAVQDERRRADAKFPPSMPDFVALCRALTPLRAPPVALPDLMQAAERVEARDRLAQIKQSTLTERRAGPLERLHDLIVEACRLAGGRLEELTMWRMTR